MKKIVSSILLVLALGLLVPNMALAEEAADAEVPSNVINLVGEALDGAVRLSWNPASDNVAVTGYQVHFGTTPVTKTGETYDTHKDVGNVVEHTVAGLDNDTPYFFAIIAYDAAGNESAKWSNEATATPDEGAGSVDDVDAPQVSSAVALNKEQVKVVFSEAIILPEEDAADAFTIDDDDKLEPLVVLGAEMDEEDETNKTVIIETEDQTEGVTYKLTVMIDIEDASGNSVISGTSDTAIFEGSGAEKPAEDVAGPEVVSVEAVDNTHVTVYFNETVVLSTNPSDDFAVVEKDDATKSLQVLGVELVKNKSDVEGAAAKILTSSQEDKDYLVTVTKLKDSAGNEVSATKNTVVFKGVAVEGGGGGGGEADTVPPKDVAKLLAKYAMAEEKYAVTLSWELLEENAGDTVMQLMYMSVDKGAQYEKKSDVAKDVKEFKVEDLEAGEYWFKLTQKDAAGNESTGAVAKVVLSETGPGVVGLVLVSLGLGHLASRRKKNRK